jgi:hypothetical protein
MEPRRVENKEQLIDLIFELLDDNDATEWENDTAYRYLQALASWLTDCDGYYQNTGTPRDTDNASWQLFADALQATAMYE